MLLKQDRVCHVNAITHEGKALLFETDVDGKIRYSVRQEGFEPGYVATPPDQRTGWEAWRELEFPAEAEDLSVLAAEKSYLTLKSDPASYLLRSRYSTSNDTAVAPVQLVSAMGHLYVFRQSKAGTLYCDRFALNGETNTLTRKLEIRYKRSKQKLVPGTNGRDTLDFSDLDGSYFFEPTTEICLVKGLQDGWFSVVLVPTNEHEVYRWHIFAYSAESKQIEITTLSMSEDGLFDVHDFTIYEPTSAVDPTLVPRVVPGVQRRALSLGAAVVNGPTAARYDLQRETGGSDKRLLKTATRILLAVPTDKGTAALSFSLATDGTLSRISNEAKTTQLRATERDVALPLSTLDNIRPVASISPLPKGVITSMARGTVLMNASNKVVVATKDVQSLAMRDTVEIKGTKSYDGVYQVSNVTPNSFDISVNWINNEVGYWEKREQRDTGLVFDGMITVYEKTQEGKLKVTAPNHLLGNGDEVVLAGTRGQDGVSLVTRLSDTQFVVERPWPESEAMNVKLLSRKRRGLVLDGADDYVELPPDAIPAGNALTVSFWAKGGATLPKNTVILSAVGQDGQPLVRISVPDENGKVVFELASNGKSLDRIEKAAQPSEYRDQWVHWTFLRDALKKEMRIYRNGISWHSTQGKDGALPPAVRARLGASAEGAAAARFYQGELSDVRIFGRALGEDEIRLSMYEPLTGNEVGFSAYYRLSALQEGNPPTILDFSTRANDGTVYGGAFIGVISLPRALRDGSPAVKYTSADLIAVAEQADHIEELEFRVNAAAPVTLASLNNFDGKGNRIFRLSCWGRSSRSAQTEITIPVSEQPFADIGGGWFRASGRFTVPAGVAMVRAFEIAGVSGDFVSIEVRRHRLRCVEDAVSEARYTDAPTLTTLADAHAEVAKKLADLRVKEERESQLRAERAVLTEQIDGLARLEENKLKLDSLRTIVQDLRETERTRADDYSRQVASPFNYYCVLGNSGASASDRVQAVARTALVLQMSPAADVPAQRWRFRDAGDGAYFIENAAIGAAQRVLVLASDASTVQMGASADVQAQKWKVVADGAGGYYLYNVQVGDNRRLQATKHGNVWDIELQSAGNDPRHHYTLSATAEVCTTAVADALAAWQQAKAELARREAELASLTAIVTADEPQRVALRSHLHQVTAELGQLRADMGRLNLEITTMLGKAQKAPLAMPRVAEDSRGLATSGAMLGFLQAASRLSSVETCEGNVQLTYFDQDGRARATSYDVTADSRNATFEEWIPDGQRTCLNLAANRGVVELSPPLELAPENTIEAWAYLPLPSRDWNVLASDTDGVEQPIVACDGKTLGVRSQGFFFGSSASLVGLSTGWHHIAAVKTGAGPDVRISFYVDGALRGAPVSPRTTALLLDGLNDSVSLPPAVIQAGAQLSISFWAMANSSRESTLLQAVDSLGLPVCSIALPGAGGAISFDCGNDGKTVDRIDKLAQREEIRGEWSHFTFTKNALTGAMKIYRNGKLWHSEVNKKKFLPAASAVTVGRAVGGAATSFEGLIADLRIWSRELSQDEVGALLGIPLPGLGAGLVGQYRFAGAGAADSSPAGHHGTIQGAPRLVEVIASPDRIAYLGSRPGSSSADAPALALRKRAMRFDGIDDHVALPPMTIDASQGLTVEMWVKYNSFKNWSRLVDLGNGLNLDNILLLNKDTSNTLSFMVYQGTQQRIIDAPGALELGQWMHIAATVDAAGNGVVYKNGQPIATGILPVVSSLLRSQCFIGKNVVASQGQLDGQMAEVRLWSLARSPSEIQGTMYQRLTGREQGLRAYYPLDDVRADLAAGNVLDLAGDSSGTAANGVVVSDDDTLPVTGLGTDALKDECFGRLAEVRIWSIPLTGDEIATNSKLPLSGNEPGLAAYYPMAEGKGWEVRDAAGYNGPGTVRSRFAAAVLSLDGAGDSVTVADSAHLRLTAYTVELWMKPNGVPNEEWKGVFGKPGRNFNIWLNRAGFIHHQFHVGGNTSVGAPDTPAGSIKWHQWNHVAITNDGKLARTYINGKLMAEGPTGGMPTADPTALIIGANLDGKPGNYFKGRLADVRLWSRGRTQDEIQSSLRSPLSGKEDGLVACWPMNAIKSAGDQRTLVDLTGKSQAIVTKSSVVADGTLPIKQRSRLSADDSLWWGFTGAMGNLGHRTLAFNGKDAHMALPPMNIDSSQGLTLEAWVKYNSFQKWSRVFDLGNGQGADNIVLANEETTGTLVLSVFRGATSVTIKAPAALEPGRWIHLAATIDPAGNACLYRNGRLVLSGKAPLPNTLERTKCYVGRSNWATDAYFHGQMSDLRIWSKARAQTEIQTTMYERLTGRETGLAAYWPMEAIVPGAAGTQTEDRAPNARHAVLSGPVLCDDNLLPIGGDALVSTEHRTADINPATQRPYLLMRRLFACPVPEGACLFADKRVEELTTKWVGNAQFAPTLLGYIEGAPPVPSENLTESDDYNGATSVELTSSEDTEFRWSRSEEFGMGASLDLFLGAETEVSVGLGAYTKVLDLRIGAKASLNFSKQSMHETNITSRSSLRMTDRLELRGTAESDPKFPDIGRRFVPKNIGYALIISGVADMYVTSLARSGKMLGYQVRPVEGVPPEVNTVTFLMNPAYVMQGSLDGMTGSRATSSRYNRQVPEMRAQYGSSYPASFYRPDEARELKEKIERWDKEREAYFQQFEIRPGFEEFSAPDTGAGVDGGFQREGSSEVSGWPQEMRTAWNDPSIESPPDAWEDDWVKKWNKELASQQKEQAKKNKDKQADIVDAAKAKISTLVDKVKEINGKLGYEAWQKKMEDIQISAGKRNIVNTYVWDADGGLRSEAQSFATTAEHTIGGTFQMDGSLGLEASIGVSAFKVELTALATMNMTQTVSKTETHTRGIELVVDLSGVESTGITDYADRPILPGEKVDRYRFMSFYLEGSTDNYNEFFRQVVDPEWLQGNDEEAQSLRQAMGKANKAWRILHRVTYVERPGALGPGATVPRLISEQRPQPNATARFDDLTLRTLTLEGKLDEILALLREKDKAKP